MSGFDSEEGQWGSAKCKRIPDFEVRDTGRDKSQSASYQFTRDLELRFLFTKLLAALLGIHPYLPVAKFIPSKHAPKNTGDVRDALRGAAALVAPSIVIASRDARDVLLGAFALVSAFVRHCHWCCCCSFLGDAPEQFKSRYV